MISPSPAEIRIEFDQSRLNINDMNFGTISSSFRTHSSANGASPASASPFAPPVPMASHPQTLGLPPASTTPTETTAPTGAFSRVRPRTPPQERMRKREKDLADEAKKSKLADMQDLIHLDMPLSEDSVMRVLQSRFFNQKYFVSSILFVFF